MWCNTDHCTTIYSSISSSISPSSESNHEKRAESVTHYMAASCGGTDRYEHHAAQKPVGCLSVARSHQHSSFVKSTAMRCSCSNSCSRSRSCWWWTSNPAALLTFAIVLSSLPTGSIQGPHERRLLNDLLRSYNTLERPVANESEPIIVSFGITLQQIIDVDEKNQIIKTLIWLNMDEKNQLLISNIWLKLEWVDVNLRWNVSEYGNIQDLRIPPSKIWKPDVLMYNSADEGFDRTYPVNVVVRNNGSCTYIPPGIFKSTCKIDITWFPFDDQKCNMKFGSWTYDGYQLDLTQQSTEGGDITNFIANGEWDLIGVPGVRNTMYYTCCPQPYVDITFTIHIRRRTLYYGFNLIIPCVLISSMTLLGFTLPPESGEKLTLGVTILLSLTVFLNLVAETMPSTSDAVPLIGVTILLSLTVFLNLVAETLPQTSDAMPLLGVTVLLSLTVFLLLVAEIMPPTSDAVPLIGTYFACIMIMVAFSVVLTVVVLNYHHRNVETHEMPSWVKTLFLQWLPWILRMDRPGKKITRKSIMMNNKMRELELKERSSKSLLANVLDIDDDFRQTANSASYLRVPTTAEDGATTSHACISVQRELAAILKEIRFITNRIRKDDEIKEIIGDWKFAAMVVDRVCLIMFSLFTVLSTCVCLFSAPHLIA